MLVEPEETPVDHWDLHERAAIVTVPDSNGIRRGCRDPIALWRISHPLCANRYVARRSSVVLQG